MIWMIGSSVFEFLEVAHSLWDTLYKAVTLDKVFIVEEDGGS